jgi:quercetin dioxygenase-like cupin family protein
VTKPDPYFGAPTEAPTAPGRYVRVDEIAGIELPGGPVLRPVLGDGMMVSFASYEPHTEAPLHAHAEEQFFVMLDGELEMELDGEVRTMRRGDVALIPAWVPHRVTAGDRPASQLDVFCPPRRGILDRMR